MDSDPHRKGIGGPVDETQELFAEVLEVLRDEYGHEGGMSDGSSLAKLMRRVAEQADDATTWEEWCE